MADWVIFDPSSTWVVSASTLKSGSLATPWLGKSIQGRVLHTHVGTAKPTC
ncbi:MAG: hypothetical protein SNJ68_14655 [Cyanobacteriota bacterium]